MKNRIALRLLMYFAAALLMFAVLSSLLFQTLFTRHTIEAKKEELQSRATNLAQTLSDVLTGKTQGLMMGGGQGGGYGAYVRMLSLIDTDAWVLDENLEFLSSGHMMGGTLTYSDLPEDAEMLVKDVFQGKTPFSQGFGDLLGAPTLTVGVPIYQGEKVAGALLLHDAVSGMRDAAAQGVNILLLSGAAALLVSTLLAMLLSFSFARPLNKMKETALKLSDGNYDATTGVAQKDEIGKLAQAIDVLSVRLTEARQAGEKQDQLRRDFLANVSHELRTPVTVLRGSLEALCEGVVTEVKQVDDYHSQMLRETIGLQRLVNDLMDLARLQNVDFPMESATISLNDVLMDALRGAEHMAREKDIRIERDIPEGPVTFSGDYGRLRQMFLIVLDNAVKFSPAHSKVYVTLSAQCAAIRDEGPGIQKEDLPYIFDRFHKQRTEENRQGSGLGLAIAKQIAARHNINISAESEFGHGTVFTFRWEQL
jgi:signal transduction histidine kinase